MTRPGQAFALAAALLLVSLPPVFAQGAGKWEVEVHGGGAFAAAEDGTAVALPPATSMLSFGGCPFCPTALRVSSWYFGDGTTLLNNTVQQYRLPGQAVALDSILRTSVASWPNTGSIGMRLSRALTPRFAAEFALDYHLASLDFTSEATAGLEQSRGGFATAFNSLFTLGPFSNPRVSSTLDTVRGSARRLDSTGVLIVNLATRARLIPYIAGGGGITSIIGDEPSATLKGAYQFSFSGLSPFDERDTVTVHASLDRHLPVGVFGGGVKWNASSSWGIRADIREQLSGARSLTVIDATPASTPASGFSLVTISGFEPSIQFSNVATIPTSLSGPPLAGATTFKADGLHMETHVTAGLFWRF